MLILIRNLFLTFLFLLPISSFSQTKEALKKQKLAIEQDIIYNTELLLKTKDNKTRSLNYLKALESQIISKEQLLITLDIESQLISKQIKKTEHSIIQSETEITVSERDLAKVKDEYAKMIYAVFKKKNIRNDFMFILSAADFNQAFKRVLYLKQYSVFRINQAKKIKELQIALMTKRDLLSRQKIKLINDSNIKIELLDLRRTELKVINAKKNEKQKLVKKLNGSESFFKKKLDLKKKQAQDLNDRIKKIIEEEIAKAKMLNSNTDYSLTPEALNISSEFSKSKGKLPWPLKRGVIVGRFGKITHSIFTEVETFNNGIDIATDKNSDVRVIFNGTVSRVFFIKGKGKAILINHGEYFSVYSGLKEVIVKTGNKLKSKQKIGVVLTYENDNKTELHFEIWKGFDKLDPSNWLYNAY